MTARPTRPGSRTRRVLLATAALAATTLGLAGPASASGPVLVSSGDLDVSAQRAVVSWIDGQQHMLLELDLSGSADPGATAVLLLATPTAPEVTVADPAVMQAFVDAGSPEITEEEHWWPDLESFSGGAETPAWERPEVTLELAGEGIGNHGAASAADLIANYEGQGYELSDDTKDAIQTYAGGGWTFLVVKIDPGEGSLDARSLPVLDLRFASPFAVVPMLLTSGGALPVQLSTYVLGTERLDRTSMPSSADVRFSGPVSAADEPALTDWLAPYGGAATMTVVDQRIGSNATITEDIQFGPSIYGPVSAGTEVRRVERIILGIPAGLVLVAGGMLVVAIGGVTASRLMQRGYRD